MIRCDTVRYFDSHYERYIAIHQSLNMQKREYAVVSLAAGRRKLDAPKSLLEIEDCFLVKSEQKDQTKVAKRKEMFGKLIFDLINTNLIQRKKKLEFKFP